MTTSILAALEKRREFMVEALRALVEAESPSGDDAAVARCADVLDRIGTEMLGAPATRGEIDGSPYVSWTGVNPSIAIIGHFDTVWPVGTLAEIPFAIEQGCIRGPGVFDMKAGIVQGLVAAAHVGLEGVTLLFTGDEELGSPKTRPLIEQLARRVDAVLVLEPASGLSLKTARKGSVVLEARFLGREAHAGLEPEAGLNAAVEAARFILHAAGLADAPAGTTVTPTIVQAGQAINAVPARATVCVDVRAWREDELDRVESALMTYEPGIDGIHAEVGRLAWRPPLEERQSQALFELACRAAEASGLDTPTGAAVGGGSDGCLTAAVGTPTLDGLGPVGGGAHAPNEHVLLDALAPRAALVAALVDALRRELTSPGAFPGVRFPERKEARA